MGTHPRQKPLFPYNISHEAPSWKACLVLAPCAQHPLLCAPPQIIKQSIVELKLQAEDSFVLKVVQLEELLQVRHSVFVIGNAGSGKSQACPTLVHSSVLPEGL